MVTVPIYYIAGTTPATGTARYYSQDNIGSTRRLRDASKASLGQYEYEPYGDIYSESGASTSYKFTGHVWEETAALYYAPSRYYMPSSGRWINRDPLGIVDGPNVYLYVGASPVRFTDALGEACGPGVIGDVEVLDRCILWPIESFKSCCEEHDRCYGCTEDKTPENKTTCDNQFKDCMHDDCRNELPIFRLLCRACAQTYYNAVHLGGQGPFENADDCPCDDDEEGEE